MAKKIFLKYTQFGDSTGMMTRMLSPSNYTFYLLRMYNRLKFYISAMYSLNKNLLRICYVLAQAKVPLRDRKRIILIYRPSNVTNTLDHFIYFS